MADPAPDTSHRERATRKSGWLLLNGGTLLFVCLFLPAMENCGDPLYPIEFVQHPFGWPLLLPYLLGLAAAGMAVKALFFPDKSARGWQVATLSLGLACFVAGTSLYTVMAVDEPGVFAIPVIPCCLFLPLALRALRRRSPLAWRSARALWIGAAVCVIHFGFFAVVDAIEGDHSSDDRLLFGLYLSLIASIALVVAGAWLERLVEQPPPADPPPLPPARIARG